MSFTKTGEHRPNALEIPIEIDPLEKLRKLPLKRLDYLLRFIKERKPEILSAFIGDLATRYAGLVKGGYAGKSSLDMEEILSDLPDLGENVDLAGALVDYCLQTLQVPQDTELNNGKVNVATRYELRSFLLPRYYNLLTLVDILGRADAIAFYKRFFTQYLIDKREPDRKRYDSLEELYEERRSREAEEPSAWVIVRGMIAGGKYAYRNDNCL